MRKLVSCQRIVDVIPMEGCDNIELIQVLGWQCIVAKSENFKVGDLVIYFEIDSMIPEYMREELAFMNRTNWRVRTIKMRGYISQGIVISLNQYAKLVQAKYGEDALINLTIPKEDDDLTESLKVEKYEPPVSMNSGLSLGRTTGKFIENCPKTDETRVQSLSERDYQNIRELDDEFVATEKIDGSSQTCALIDNEFKVCSHNLEKDKEGNCTFWEYAIKLNVEEKMRMASDKFGLGNWVLQGELCGEGIQSNRLGMKGKTILFFYAFNIDTQEYFEWNLFKDVMEFMELETVPVITENFILPENKADLVTMVDGIKSKIDNNKLAEGYVIFAKHNHKLIRGSRMGRISIKAISNTYLEKEK